MNLVPLSPDNSTVVLVDHAIGFATLLRSHDLREHVNNVVGLAKTAKLYGAPLVVTNGEASKPSGPLYPELLAAIGDQQVIERRTAFNSFLDEDFAAAVKAAGNNRLVIAGIATDGCVLQTALGALREGYEVYVVADATASTSREAHDMAIQRLVMAGVVPLTWWSLAAEYQLEPRFRLLGAHPADGRVPARHDDGRTHLLRRGRRRQDPFSRSEMNRQSTAPCKW